MGNKDSKRSDAGVLQGTLDMLILRTLVFGPRHGHAIASTIEQTSGDALRIDHGSLYPALQRLERRGWVKAEWGTSDNNRKAKFYRLTPSGRKQLAAETDRWERMVRAVTGVLQSES